MGVRKANGYLSNDGMFFESKEEAELHDCLQELRDLIASQGLPEEVELFLLTNHNFILKFIKALQAEHKRNEKRNIPDARYAN